MYDNALEKKAIDGPEQRTARANGEIGLFESTRFNHNGLPVIVPSSISTTVKRPETFKFLENLNYQGINFKGMDYTVFKK
jgi:hypothetical protein